MTFEQVMEFTGGVSGAAAFEEPCCRLYWETLQKAPLGGNVLEIGVEFGRSTSIVLQAARERNFHVFLVDPFVDPVSGPEFMRMAGRLQVPFSLHVMTSAKAMTHIPMLDFALIDGDHTSEAVWHDCAMVLNRLKPGGFICWHDYGHDSLPEVKPVVDEWLRGHGLEVVGQAHTLLVARRLV